MYIHEWWYVYIKWFIIAHPFAVISNALSSIKIFVLGPVESKWALVPEMVWWWTGRKAIIWTKVNRQMIQMCSVILTIIFQGSFWVRAQPVRDVTKSTLTGSAHDQNGPCIYKINLSLNILQQTKRGNHVMTLWFSKFIRSLQQAISFCHFHIGTGITIIS